MPNEIQLKDSASAGFTITLASLADASSRQSTMITNSDNYPAALVHLKITVGTSPTANTNLRVYLLRSDGTIADDNAGASDAAITIVNAPLLGQILVDAATSDTAYYGVFDTSHLGALGSSWGIAVKNETGVALNSTGGNHDCNYVTYLPEIQ